MIMTHTHNIFNSPIFFFGLFCIRWGNLGRCSWVCPEGPSLAAASCWLGLDTDNGIGNWQEGGRNPAGLLAVVAPSSLSSGQCQMITLFPRCLAASNASVLEGQVAWEAFEDLGLAVCLSLLLKPQPDQL